MEFKVRKGVETPCKIHSMLVRDFYLMVAYLAVAAAVLLLELVSFCQDGCTWEELAFVFFLLLAGAFLLSQKLYGRASRKKYRPPYWERTVTNRNVRNTLMKNI